MIIISFAFIYQQDNFMANSDHLLEIFVKVVKYGSASYIRVTTFVISEGTSMPSYLLMNFTRAIFDSSIARCFPMQLLGPALNPPDAKGWMPSH